MQAVELNARGAQQLTLRTQLPEESQVCNGVCTTTTWSFNMLRRPLLRSEVNHRSGINMQDSSALAKSGGMNRVSEAHPEEGTHFSETSEQATRHFSRQR